LLANVKTKKRTILIIDDEFKILLGLRALLERNGFKVITCEDSLCGIKTAAESLPDLIICDIMLPLMNGFKIREEISSNSLTKDIPFLFLSARASKADKISGFAAGADDYITKPFDPQELAARIHAIFRRQDLNNQDAVREINLQIERIQAEISNNVSHKLQSKLQSSMTQLLSRRDNETEEHARRVIILSESLARALGKEGQALEHIRLGALLHDIGMVGISDDILLSTSILTDEERKVMMTHVALGKKILDPLGLPLATLELVYHHHENWDGSGYPDGLAGEGIPLTARIFAIVDVWDALTSDRTYRKAWSEEKAIAYIKEQTGKHFDPYIAEKFLYIIQRENKGR
jgi:putative two-component system response regulator